MHTAPGPVQNHTFSLPYSLSLNAQTHNIYTIFIEKWGQKKAYESISFLNRLGVHLSAVM